MLCGSAVLRKVISSKFYLVRVTWSNVVNAKVWLVLVDNGLQMCLVSTLNLHIALAIW